MPRSAPLRHIAPAASPLFGMSRRKTRRPRSWWGLTPAAAAVAALLWTLPAQAQRADGAWFAGAAKGPRAPQPGVAVPPTALQQAQARQQLSRSI
ncbi:hypothetical protein ACLQ9R_17085, partial [Bordetella hinzii]